MTNKIVYFGDPLCSWCYGFASEITKVIDHFENLDFELVMGGLRPYGTEKISELAGMLKHHWEEVHERSKASFQFDMLNTDFVYDTEPPSRAVVAMQQLNKSESFQFFKDVQRAFYYHGKDTSQVDTYLELIEGRTTKLNFINAFESKEVKEATKESFSYTKQLGIQGFPATLLEFEDRLYLVANGYTDAPTVINAIDRILSGADKKAPSSKDAGE